MTVRGRFPVRLTHATWLFACLLGLLQARAADAQGDIKKQPDARIEALIDNLVKVADGDFGYSGGLNGSVFLPVDAFGRLQGGLLFQKPLAQSSTMRELVKLGPKALPQLLVHLDDKRRTTMRIEKWGFGRFEVSDDPFFDMNGLVESYRFKAKADIDEKERDDEGGSSPPWWHNITVGDLCFVAIGQILNRDFTVVRYIPSMSYAIHSPTYGPRLAMALKAQYGDLTPEKHRELLLADFFKPDSQDRRNDAAKRLAYYYPEALDPVIPKLLSQPTYDGPEVQRFLNNKLYEAKNLTEAKKHFDDFVQTHNESYRTALMRCLFDDLRIQELNAGSKFPLPKRLTQPRRLLIALFGQKENVRSADRPAQPVALTSHELAMLITEGLGFDDSTAIDKAVQGLLQSLKADDELALACMQRLIGRGYDGDVENYLARRKPRGMVDDEAFFQKQIQPVLRGRGWTRLHVAVHSGRLDQVKQLLAANVDVNAQGWTGESALHVAVAAKNLEVVALLLKAKADANRKDKDGLPIQKAVDEDLLDIARLLIEAKSDLPDIRAATLAGNVKAMEASFLKDKSALNALTKQKWTPLHLAAWADQAEAARWLLERGANVEALDDAKTSPLHIASLSGSEAVVRLLLASKAKIGEREDNYGAMPLHFAAITGQIGIAKTLLEHGADKNAEAGNEALTAMHLAAANGHIPTLELLLSKGCQVDVVDSNKQTPLHLAAKAGQRKVVEFLLANKAKINSEDQWSRTPLHSAIVDGHLGIVELLLQRGADIHAEMEFGETPLRLSQRYEQTEITELLKKKGAKK